jgi:hypothetical protein
MATRNEWLALAERCKNATASDREIDAAIMFDAFAVPVGQMSDGGPRGYLWPSDNPSWSFGIRFPGKDRDWFAKQRQGDEKETLLIERDGALVLMSDLRVPALTASLDVITALIARELPDYAWLRKGETYMTVYRRPADDKTWARHIDAPGATPALALCAAFCRAKAARAEA